MDRHKGRPRKSAKRQTSKAVAYLTADEKRALAKKARDSGLSESLFIRAFVQRIMAGENVA